MGYLSGYDDDNGLVLEAVRRECRRQEELKAEGRFKYTCRDPEMSDTERLAVLVEEVGEAARAVLEMRDLANDKHMANLEKELIQVAAVAVSWVEGMGRTRATKDCERCGVRKGYLHRAQCKENK